MINSIEETFEQTISLSSSDFPVATGRVQLAAQWMVGGEGIGYTPNFRSPPSWGRYEMVEEQAAEVRKIWTQLRSSHLPKPLKVAARRFSYRRERHRPEDRLVDVLVAAESLYIPPAVVDTPRG
jgi:hypothetical protein